MGFRPKNANWSCYTLLWPVSYDGSNLNYLAVRFKFRGTFAGLYKSKLTQLFSKTIILVITPKKKKIQSKRIRVITQSNGLHVFHQAVGLDMR